MPLMDNVPSRPDCSGPAKVIATEIDIDARAVIPARGHCGALPSFLRKQESLCSALDPCFRRDDGALLLASPKRWAPRYRLGGSTARGKRGSGPWMGGDPISVAMEGLRNEGRASLDRRVAANPKARRFAQTSQFLPTPSQHVGVATHQIACESE